MRETLGILELFHGHKYRTLIASSLAALLIVGGTYSSCTSEREIKDAVIKKIYPCNTIPGDDYNCLVLDKHASPIKFHRKEVMDIMEGAKLESLKYKPSIIGRDKGLEYTLTQ